MIYCRLEFRRSPFANSFENNERILHPSNYRLINHPRVFLTTLTETITNPLPLTTGTCLAKGKFERNSKVSAMVALLSEALFLSVDRLYEAQPIRN